MQAKAKSKATSATTAATMNATTAPSWVLPVRADHCIYTKQYCEENCYKLAQHLSSRLHAESKEQSEEDARTEAADAASSSSSSSSSSLSSVPPASSSSPLPSSTLLPSESLYSSLRADRVFVIFMSNSFNQLTLWKQRVGDPLNDGGVVWDYHVIVFVRPDPSKIAGMCTCAKTLGLSSSARAAAPQCPCAGWVYDLDTTLPFPCPLPLYARAAFRAHLPERAGLGPTLRRKRERLFRVCGAQQFLEQFASDRSHMLAPADVIEAVHQAAAAGEGAGIEGQAASASAAAAAARTETSRRDVQLESQTRQAEQSSWNASPVKDRLSSCSSSSSSAAAQQRRYLAPPPSYPAIRTALSDNNLDDYRFFAFPDSGKGVVMTQAELLDFFHSSI